MKVDKICKVDCRTLLLLLAAITAGAQTVMAKCTMVTTAQTFHFGIDSTLGQFEYILESGHADLEVSFTPTGWDVLVSHGQYGLTAPDDTLLYAGDNAKWDSVPAQMEFTGVEQGQPIWILPQGHQHGVTRPGFAAQRSDSAAPCPWNPADARGADEPDNWIQVRLVEVDGPEGGYFSLWQSGADGSITVYMSSYTDGITADDVYYLTHGDHTHMNWGFTKPGMYAVTFEISTVIKCDRQLTADIWPVGDQFYRGNCRVDFYDFALLARHWLNSCSQQQSCDGAGDIAEPFDQVQITDLAALTDQWLLCGYAGCQF